MNTNVLMVDVKTRDINKDIAEDVESRFDTSNFKLDRALSEGKNYKNNSINEKWIRWTNHEKIRWIKSKSILLFKREQW